MPNELWTRKGKLQIFSLSLHRIILREILFRSDTESAEDTEAKKADGNENDVTDGAESNKKEESAAKKATGNVATRVSDFFAAVKKSVKKPKESKYAAETPESEMKVIFQKFYFLAAFVHKYD